MARIMAQPIRSRIALHDRSDSSRLLIEARQARDEGQLLWAEALARRARCFEPASVDAAQMQCSLLRELGRTDQALAISEQFARG